MKTAKLVLGIITIVLSVVVFFQSSIVGIGAAMVESVDLSGSVGVWVSIFMLAAGIVAIAARKRMGGSFACFGLYGIAGGLAVGMVLTGGIYKDLMVWGVFCLICAVVCFISIFAQKYGAESNIAKK